MTAKADRIKRLVEDPDLQEAFDNVRNALFTQFAKCKTNDTDTMADIRKRLHLLDSVEANLHQAIRDGKLEDFKAVEQERPPVLGNIVEWTRKRMY